MGDFIKRFAAVAASMMLIISFATPAQSAVVKYSVYQKTLSAFSSSATTLTSQQKAQVKAAVDANPTAEKFICTGIRYFSQPMSVNIMVRKRAKAACEYAKELNPALSTWFQTKPTLANSYAGKVLLTVKSPTSSNVDEDSQAHPAVELSDPVERCMIKEVSNMRGMTGAGFPEWNSLTTKTGTVKWALIPIDFPDLQGEENFKVRVDDK